MFMLNKLFESESESESMWSFLSNILECYHNSSSHASTTYYAHFYGPYCVEGSPNHPLVR